MPSWTLDPVEKLSLAVRKNVRDNFESKKAEQEQKLANLIGVDSFTITVNANQVYAYTETSGYGKDNIGSLIHLYFEALCDSVDKYTKKGKDEEAKEVIRKVVPKNSATLTAVDNVSYCGLAIVDGEFAVVFNYKNLGSNISYAGDNIATVVDNALDALGENDLPVVSRRAIKEHLDVTIPELQEKMQKMFGKEYKFEYDIRAYLDKLAQFPDDLSWLRDRLNSAVPEFTARYFRAAVENLERLNFGKDDMLQEAFVEGTENLTVRFEIVDKLQNGKTYNDTLFADGEYKVQTAAKYFASNIDDTGRDVVDRL
ncbi:hypothetical protein AURDEDRAFT_172615 [Auricularia subglabra TFB-10046 SS5]|nr:hypothetical protein AURDEDRAFT_172615 [Auricularia subglabra TFB-10046 SS5]